MEITGFICILNVVRSAVLIDTLPGYSMQFPLTVSQTRIISSFCCCMPTTMRKYVTAHPTDILLRATKLIVFVPFSDFPGSPFAGHIFFFDSPFCQRYLDFYFDCIGSFYCSISTVSGSTTELTRYH